jgi:hypothetical protein
MMSTIYRKQIRQPRKIRFTDTEWSAIVECARAVGRPPARYVRETALGATPKTPRSHVDSELIHELGRIGATLNRIASVIGNDDSSAAAHAALEGTLAELLAAVRRLG